MNIAAASKAATINSALSPQFEAFACPPECARTLLNCMELVQNRNHEAWGEKSRIVKEYVRGHIKNFVLSGQFMQVPNATPECIVENITKITTAPLENAMPNVSLDILCAVSMVDTMHGKNPLEDSEGFTPKGMKVVELPQDVIAMLEQIRETAPHEFMNAILMVWAACEKEE